MEKENGFFVVTRIHRDDLTESLTREEIAKLTDDDMQWIAEKMGDAYLESGQFWEDLEILAKAALEFKTSSLDEYDQG